MRSSVDEGDAYPFAATYGFLAANNGTSRTLSDEARTGIDVGRAIIEGHTIHIPDVLADPEYTCTEQQSATASEPLLGVPLLREGSASRRDRHCDTHDVRAFTDKQIELVETFADQAVIAIENVRLFDEVQARTRELTQSVEELRALGVVTQAVNSTLDLQTVLDTIVAKAAQISGTEAGAIYVLDETSTGVPAQRDIRHEREHDRRGAQYACRDFRGGRAADRNA